ncbi:hypothetical protein HNP38_000726 [Chryseobacterium defluvii]|uniref:Uncharacterized protein n=1 Tax=Chryseobacterium defluvii TaxID=160396 RepID=A0A840KCD9_9FLAO|nr:hypothetical protein [Chryseobacterium defluvii]MBB4805454.1 hypothetical protein [Chryseobacterium defluvii]
MATYESFIKLKGSVGDLVFYTLNGKNVVRKKSGFSKTAFKKNPAYEKVRQNSSEFGHCSKTGKIIRQALDPYIREAEDPLLYQKFAKVMTEIKDYDLISERGKRTIPNGLATDIGKSALKKFQFGKILNLGGEASISLGLWNKSLHLNKGFSADETEILTLKIDFENYLTEHKVERIPVKPQQTEVVFEKHFSDDDPLLHFIVLRKDGRIINMGFV